MPKTKLGDRYQLGDHVLMCGDSSSEIDLDALLQGEKVQLVNTDPPYGVALEPGANNAARGWKRDPSREALKNDDAKGLDYRKLLQEWFRNLARVLEPGRSFYIWGGYANIANYPAALEENGLYFSQAIIWVKGHPVLTRKDFMGNHEWCFYGWREGAGHWFAPEILNATDTWKEKLQVARKGGRDVFVVEVDQEIFQNLPSDVWEVKKVSPTKMIHLTEKPVDLALRAINYSSRPGEIVLDLFGGSGSTLIAAEMTGRRARVMELDPTYCDVIVARWEAFTGKKSTLLG